MRLGLSSDNLLLAYACGIFPMGSEEGEIMWFAPDPRAILPLGSFSASRSLRSVVRRDVFDVTVNRCFDRVIDNCAHRSEGTWICDEIKEAYTELHRLGHAHSVETWRDGELAGGLYGVALGGAFFGESMFRSVTDASKVALVHLVRRLLERGFVLLDVQFPTEHLSRFGAVEIPRAEYERRLEEAIQLTCTFQDGGEKAPGDS